MGIIATDIEVAVMRHFNYRRNIIVPNVSWGAVSHECDVLVLRKSGYAAEVEIKVSLSDLKADKGKRHGHRSEKIRELWFAVPDKLEGHIGHIPTRAGILLYGLREVVVDYQLDPQTNSFTPVMAGRPYLEALRKPEINKSARKWSEYETQKLLHLGCMRIESAWRSRKKDREKIADLRTELKYLKKFVKKSGFDPEDVIENKGVKR